ncbi:macrolide family glycosyltransferase [Sphaerisporangium sp. B11E5]|uniref:macrolide family glycosyltransferase n=1 Tax=Sphaerisporangium sp. B11E5 TaxID=3153563 RepID=UPI00325F2924
MRTAQHIVMVGCTAPSHVYPSLGIIRELVARGHRVSYVVGEPLRELVAATGAGVVGHPSRFPLGEEAWPQDPGEAMRVFLDEAVAVWPGLVGRFDADRPDLVLYDIGGLAGPLLGVRYGVRAVQLSPTYVAWEGYEADMAEVLSAVRGSASGRAYHAAFNEWLRSNGVGVDAWEWLGSPGDVLSLIPRAMQPHADRVPARVRFVGPCLDPARMAEGGWEPPGDGRRVLLVSFGTAYTEQLPVYRACVEGFAGADWHVVMAVGDRVDPAELGVLPPGVEVRRRVPQLAVLEVASAFVTHTGMGGCAESLWYGVPTVAVPQAVDQFGNAARLEELGVGVRLAGDAVDAVTLREAVERVAGSAQVAARVAELRAAVRAEGGIERAVAAVESFLG